MKLNELKNKLRLTLKSWVFLLFYLPYLMHIQPIWKIIIYNYLTNSASSIYNLYFITWQRTCSSCIIPLTESTTHPTHWYLPSYSWKFIPKILEVIILSGTAYNILRYDCKTCSFLFLLIYIRVMYMLSQNQKHTLPTFNHLLNVLDVIFALISNCSCYSWFSIMVNTMY